MHHKHTHTYTHLYDLRCQRLQCELFFACFCYPRHPTMAFGEHSIGCLCKRITRTNGRTETHTHTEQWPSKGNWEKLYCIETRIIPSSFCRVLNASGVVLMRRACVHACLACVHHANARPHVWVFCMNARAQMVAHVNARAAMPTMFQNNGNDYPVYFFGTTTAAPVVRTHERSIWCWWLVVCTLPSALQQQCNERNSVSSLAGPRRNQCRHTQTSKHIDKN